MKLIISFCFILIGCNSQLIAQKIVSIDPVLDGYVENFIQIGHLEGHDIIIDNLVLHFTANLGEEILGQCSLGVTPAILISEYYWDALTEIEKTITVFHELGHCILLRSHDEVEINMGGYVVPQSVMYPYILEGEIYSTYWKYYTHELFNFSH